MIQRLRWLFTPSRPYKNPIEAQHAVGLLYFMALALVLSIIGAIVQGIAAQSIVVENDVVDIEQIALFISPFFLFIGFWLVRAGYYQAVAMATVVFSLLAVYPVATGTLDSSSLVALVLPIVASGMLLGWRITLTTLFTLLLMLSLNTIIAPTLTTDMSDFLPIALILTIIAFYLIVFGTAIENSAARFLKELNSLRDVVRDTVEQEIVRDEVDLVRDAVDLIRDNLGFHFARMFVVQAGKVTQRIQTGLNLKQMNVDSDFELGTNSGIYEAVRTRQLVHISNASGDAIRQHLLSGTRGALAVPIFANNEVIGVLDIQSEDSEIFADSDLNTLRLIARQLGINIGQKRLLSTLKSDLEEQTTVMERQRERLITLERRERQATTQAWANYLKQRGIDFMGFDLNNMNDIAEPAFSLGDDMQPAIQTGEIGVVQEGDEQILSVPILLRGYTLGAMSFRVPEGNQTIGPRQQELIRSVVQRLALALENKRLFEQSQAQASRESKANEVGSLLLSSTDINTVLRLAVDRFNQAMGAIQTQIVIQPDTNEANGGEIKA